VLNFYAIYNANSIIPIDFVEINITNSIFGQNRLIYKLIKFNVGMEKDMDDRISLIQTAYNRKNPELVLIAQPLTDFNNDN
jgi:hypothetical protein